MHIDKWCVSLKILQTIKLQLYDLLEKTNYGYSKKPSATAKDCGRSDE